MQNVSSTVHEHGMVSAAARAWLALVLLLATLLMTVPIYAGWLSGNLEPAFRFGLPLLWGGLSVAAARSKSLKPISTLLLSLFAISLGFAIAYVVGNRPLEWLGLSSATPKGAAVAKISSEVLPVCGAILLASLCARLSLEFLGLRGGRVWLSLGLGLLATLPLLLLFAVDPSGGRDSVLSTPAATIRSWLQWILLFSVANGLMEELWFRGLWYGVFKQVIGSSAAMHVTSVAFCMMHVIVYWSDVMVVAMLTPAWLFMGYAYALILRRTGSLWGPVAAHAIADVLFLLIAFSAGKM
jgi:membrane protease YdiL (CAAX protease family)